MVTITEKSKRMCITVKDIQEEYIHMDSRKLRAFLNTHLHYKKIGHTYYYIRHEVEALLLNESENQEFPIRDY